MHFQFLLLYTSFSPYLCRLPCSLQQGSCGDTAASGFRNVGDIRHSASVQGLQLPGTHIPYAATVPWFGSSALLQALQERTIPSFHALLSSCVSIICPQNWKSWANLNPEPVWVRMISTLQRKKMTESILHLSACSLSTCQMLFILRPKPQLPGSHHSVIFAVEISEENGPI